MQLTSDPLTAFLRQNAALTGSKAIACLRSQPGNPVFCKALSLALDQADTLYSPEQLQILTQAELPLPMTDARTLQEVRREMVRAIRIKAHLLSENLSTASIDQHITALETYIRQTTTPYGIKSFVTDEKTAYDRIYIAIRRCLAKAEKHCPPAASEIKSHLSTGRYFLWRP
jgi:hypothetical protein